MNKKVFRSLFLLTIITGSIFTFVACGPEVKEPVKAPAVSSTPTPVQMPAPAPAPAQVDSTPVSTKYMDGTYTKAGSYQSPGGDESIIVTVSLKNDAVQSVSVDNQANNEASKNFQSLFIEGINDQVVGQKIDDVNVGVVNGSSLTGIGFNEAIGQIRSAAQK